MNQKITRFFILISVLITFTCGLYGIYYRHPTRLFDEIKIYLFASIITLSPFILAWVLAKKETLGNTIIAIGSIITGIFGGYIYLSEMVFSRGPSWGFSLLIAPAAQALCLLILWGYIAVYRASGK